MHMISITILLALGLALAAGMPSNTQRIVGGSETTIQTYPFSAALLYTRDFINYQQRCGGSLVNNRAVVTSAQCVHGDAPIRWRIRVGSNYANFGGTVTNANLITVNPNYNVVTKDADLAIVRSATTFVFSTTIRAGSIAGTTYNLPDNALVRAIGWGATRFQGESSETLRNVDIWTINQTTCRSRYAELGYQITDNMVCAGWLDVGGRSFCAGDNGSPLIHVNAIVGIFSWSQNCGLPRYPSVLTRVSRYTTWITSNA